MNVQDLRLNSEKIVNGYIDQSDWRTRENANSQFSFSGLLLYTAGTTMAHYALKHMYPPRVAKAHYDGEIHLHDLSLPTCGYCCGHDLRAILAGGLVNIGHVESSPAKHFGSALMQLVNFLGIAQNDFSGAQAVSSLDTLLSPFIAYDNLKRKEVKQILQEFIFNLNMINRWGSQPGFTNVTLSLIPDVDLRDEYVVIGGKIKENKYSDYIDEQEIFNDVLFDILMAGDKKGRPFIFPIPTVNIGKDFPWGSDLSLKLFELTAKYGLPYFDNFVGSNLNPNDTRSLCCHLRLPLNELQAKGGGGLFGYGSNVGSLGVVTIDMNRIGYLAKSEANYFELLDYQLNLAKISLEIKRKYVIKSIEQNLLPTVKQYIGNMDHFFSTIGILGCHDSLLNFLGEGIETDVGRKFAVSVLTHIRKKMIEFQEETGNLYALEATPAESSSYRLGKKDKELYPDIRIANLEIGGEVPYLTNSTQLPVGLTDDPFEALDLQEELQSLYNSGTVFHLFVGESTPVQPKVVQNLIRKITGDYKIPTLTYTPTFSVCPNCGLQSGEHYTCPKCKKQCEVYSRVVGYLRPVSQWNRGKQEEFKDRKNFVV